MNSSSANKYRHTGINEAHICISVRFHQEQEWVGGGGGGWVAQHFPVTSDNALRKGGGETGERLPDSTVAEAHLLGGG